MTTNLTRHVTGHLRGKRGPAKSHASWWRVMQYLAALPADGD
jgi:hypothetical protein